MLFQLNYQFLASSSQLAIKKVSSKAPVPVPTDNQKLEPPKVNGPIDHVAFVIHGIGQQTEEFGFFQKHLQSLYNTTNKAVEENIPDRDINVQYVPIEWHKQIHQETDAAMDDITLRSIPTMRMVNNDYLADAFFYLSKDRGQSIVTHVTHTFNQAYFQFITENPGFTGKIAILAYSLGGIITWDILSNQLRPNVSKQDIQEHSKLDLDFPALAFKPDYLFTLGSPLSAFLTVRNQNPNLYRPDPSIVFENIFHPFDPLAYRFEPMLKPEYKHHPAVLVDDSSNKVPLWNKGLAWLTNSLVPTTTSYQGFSNNNKHEGGGLMSALKSYFTFSSLSTPGYPLASEEESNEDVSSSATSTPKLSLDCGSETYDDEDEQDFFHTITPTNDDTDPFIYIPHQEPMISSKKRRSCEDQRPVYWQQPADKKRRKSNEEVVLLRTTVAKGSSCHVDATEQEPSCLTQRIDYVLRPERFFGLAKNEYVSGLTAHFSYWTHQDLMWHIVRRLENFA